MYRELLADATFHNLLLACDRDLADTARAGRCSLCGGVLHSATYPRKPRGRPERESSGPSMTGASASAVLSMVAARERRRRRCASSAPRSTSPRSSCSSRSCGTALAPKRVQRMNEAVGVDRRTVERWRRWWRDNFTATPFWQIARAAFMPPVEHERLPGSLLDRFGDDSADASSRCCASSLPSPEAEPRSIVVFLDPQRDARRRPSIGPLYGRRNRDREGLE